MNLGFNIEKDLVFVNSTIKVTKKARIIITNFGS